MRKARNILALGFCLATIIVMVSMWITINDMLDASIKYGNTLIRMQNK